MHVGVVRFLRGDDQNVRREPEGLRVLPRRLKRLLPGMDARPEPRLFSGDSLTQAIRRSAPPGPSTVSSMIALAAAVVRPNMRWSMDFLSDTFGASRRLRILAANDACCRENLCQIAHTRISGARVARELDAVVGVHGTPASIVADNGTEFTSRAILKWADRNKLAWPCIDPRKPRQNGFLERLNASLRDELLNAEIFDNLPDVRRKLARWRYDCTHVRPHSALGNLPPAHTQK